MQVICVMMIRPIYVPTGYASLRCLGLVHNKQVDYEKKTYFKGKGLIIIRFLLHLQLFDCLAGSALVSSVLINKNY